MSDWQAATGHVTRVAVTVGGDSPMPTRVAVTVGGDSPVPTRVTVGGQSVDTAASVACRPRHY